MDLRACEVRKNVIRDATLPRDSWLLGRRVRRPRKDRYGTFPKQTTSLLRSLDVRFPRPQDSIVLRTFSCHQPTWTLHSEPHGCRD